MIASIRKIIGARGFGNSPMSGGILKLLRTPESGIFLALVLLAAFMELTSPQYSTAYNIEIILLQMSVVAVVGMGQTLVMTVGTFDLSQASLAGLCAMASAFLFDHYHLPSLIAMGIGLLIGLIVGALNGILAAYLRLNPIILTLASGIALAGLTYFMTSGYPIVDLPPEFSYLGSGELFGVATPIVLTVVVVVAMHILLTRTLFGRRVIQVGGNQEAAKGLGINIEGVRTGVFAISGLLSALGGLMILGRVGNATPEIGQGLLFPIVTAVILGGTLLSGGSGTMIGTLIGATFMAMVTNAMVLHQINIYLLDTVQGALVIVALIVDQFRRGELTLRKLVGRE